MRRGLLLLVLTTLGLGGRAWADAPKRAVILVFDQARAEYPDRFDLPNFKRA